MGGGGGGGGGGIFGPHHQTGSQNSRTLSPRVSKISDFFFYAFWTHCGKTSGRLICQGGLLQSFFEKEVMKNRDMNIFVFV